MLSLAALAFPGGGEVYSSLTDAFALKIGPSFHSPTQNCHQRMIRGSSLSIKRFWTICLSETWRPTYVPKISPCPKYSSAKCALGLRHPHDVDAAVENICPYIDYTHMWDVHACYTMLIHSNSQGKMWCYVCMHIRHHTTTIRLKIIWSTQSRRLKWRRRHGCVLSNQISWSH